MRHLHLAFIGAVCAFVLAILLAPTFGGGSESSTVPLERTYEAPAEGVVCCTWVSDGKEHSCIATPGRTCDICTTACS